MMSLRLTSAVFKAQSSRMLSTQTTMAIEKLKDVLEQYRQTSYTQELPSRFKKDIVKAAALRSGDSVTADGLTKVLKNVAPNALSEAEIKSIFNELGRDGQIPAQSMVKMI